jgi:GNAT superfamily N-acetyltransferase
LYVIDPLSDRHDRQAFTCGIAALDRYITQQATQDIKKHYARVYVASPQDSPQKIAGFYSITVTGIPISEISVIMQRKLPRYKTVPAVLLGRLAVDLRHRGCGLGKRLLLDAFSVYLKENMAWVFFVTEAKDAKARDFYLRFGFRALNEDPDYLYVTRNEIVSGLTSQV